MEHSPLTWGERGQLWLRLGLRGALALGGLALAAWVGLPLLSPERLLPGAGERAAAGIFAAGAAMGGK